MDSKSNGHVMGGCVGSASLYKRAMSATRSGSLYNAFPYPTKISPEAIALFIAAHTQPGDVVFDGFAGSGSTGLGALLCANPSKELKEAAASLGLRVKWGPRKAILYELGVLGAFVSKTLCSPPDPDEFHQAAETLVDEVERDFGWMYEAVSPDGEPGHVRHAVWSDALVCPNCRKHVSQWDACVSRKPAKIASTFSCPLCRHRQSLDGVKKVVRTTKDDLLTTPRKTRQRQLAWVYGKSKGKTWTRRPNSADQSLLRRIEKERIPTCVPKIEIPWGDLFRAGYHEGISHLHHFYTRRNLIVFGHLWAAVDRFPARMRDSLRFWLLSYNASHSTLMTRVVAKQGQDDLVVTSAQPGVLYLSGLPVEKNIFAGVRRKLKTITEAFRITFKSRGLVTVRNASCLELDLPDCSVDYVFTDPPFGGNIPYAEVNFINEAWLGRRTKTQDEVIVSPHQGKSVASYGLLLTGAFQEVHRVLKPKGCATVAFHSSSAHVWNALRSASSDSGFAVSVASVLNKTQASFKQVTTNGFVSGDPLLLLTKERRGRTERSTDVWVVASSLIDKAVSGGEASELTPQRLYSRLVTHYLSRHQDVPVGANEFYKHIAERLVGYGGTN